MGASTYARRFLQAVLVTFALGTGSTVRAQGAPVVEQPTDERQSRPNIVVFLADDLGYTDIAPFGSEINTPALTALAEQGVSFTNYHTAANCAPARAMLLTGVNNHRAGVGNIPETVPLEHRRHSQYQGVLGSNVVTVATLLEDAGYHTYMSGKWHLGQESHQLPSRRGFQRTFALADSGADNWEQKPYLPIYDKANWYADGRETRLPEDFYSSRFLVDKAIEFIDSNLGDGQPFFAYIPFQAVHIPVQAPQEYIDRYHGKYDIGWETLRQQRLERAVKLGIVPGDTTTVTMATTDDWEALNPEQKAYQAKSMAVYAGMVEAMDFHIGRLIDYLKDMGQYDNTLFIFTSDNGAEASGLANQTVWWNRLLAAQTGYNVDYETLGLKGSFNAISPSFASAAASPLSFYKFYVGEGGMRVPLIIAGETLLQKGQLSSAFAWVTDLAATILDLADVAAPQGRYAGRPVEPITGHSLSPLLRGETERTYSEDDSIGYELSGHSVLFQGGYKLVRNGGPVGDNQWHLYDIDADPGESQDLRDAMPDRFEQMKARYAAFAEENGVLPVPDGYNYLLQGTINGLHDRSGPQLLVLLLTLMVVSPFYLFHRWQKRGAGHG